ncbi:MAG: hypothetical protein COC12_06490 [Rhodobacteraceae bacterium]|nr:MAG: hypothetical protein COC12_06490 [Paracoccaceae bacterium]
MTSDNTILSHLTRGQTVLIAAFDDMPEHTFEVHSVEDDCITGVALTGPLVGEYGEPDLEMILRVIPT